VEVFEVGGFGGGVGEIEILDRDDLFFGGGGVDDVLVHFLFFLKHAGNIVGVAAAVVCNVSVVIL